MLQYCKIICQPGGVSNGPLNLPYLPIVLFEEETVVCPFMKRSKAKCSTVFLGNAFQCFHNLYSQENFLMSQLNPFCCSFCLGVSGALAREWKLRGLGYFPAYPLTLCEAWGKSQPVLASQLSFLCSRKHTSLPWGLECRVAVL